MEAETYYWVDESSNFGAGENKITYGDKIPAKTDPGQVALFLKEGWISTEKVATKRQLSRLEELEAENILLKNTGGEESKKAIDKALKTSVPADVDRIAELEESSGTGITQEKFDEAKGESVKIDLDKIKELEQKVASGITQEQLNLASSTSVQADLDVIDLVKDALEKVQQGDSKAEIWDAVKSVKDLVEGE